jgi:hypothetical protein
MHCRSSIFCVSLLPCLSLVLVCLLPGTGLRTAAAGEPWEDEAAFQTLRKQETHVLQGLLKTCLQKEYRRQAWYLAERLALIAPDDSEAANVLDTWSGPELQQGQVPKKAYAKKRDQDLRKLGDDYFHFGETLEASGMDPVTYYPINVRARAYGSQAGPLLSSMKAADYVWLGVYGPKPRAEVEKLLGSQASAFTFPEEFEDDYLMARCLWPESRGAVHGTWRLMTDHDYKEALRLLGILAAAEDWMVANMGSKAPKNDERMTNLFVFGEHQAYDKIAAEGLTEEELKRFQDTSGWEQRRRGGDRQLFVCWRHRYNAWIGDDDLMLGHASKIMARQHLAGGAGGEVWGRGAWLLEGLRGAFEGFGRNADGEGEIDPGACWRLAAARALREAGDLLPWETFFELDRKSAEAIARKTLKIEFGGEPREAKDVDVVAAQATALVVGILMDERGKGMKRLAKLIGDLIKRDSLPNLDKALGGKKGTAIAFAERAMDAAHGRDAAGKK